MIPTWLSTTAFQQYKASLQVELQDLLDVGFEISQKLYVNAMDRIWDLGEMVSHQHKLERARTWPEWSGIAATIDTLQGKDAWKAHEQSTHYDYRLLRRRLKLLRTIRERGDMHELVHYLRSGLIRGVGGSLNPALYEACLVGTKRLIEAYNQEVCDCLRLVLSSPEYPLKAKLNFFTETRYAYGKTALLLSGGATLGMYHLGVVKALYELNMLPRIIAGASVGSLVASMVCATSWSEMGTIFQKGALKCDSFSGLERGSLFRKLKRFLREGHLMDIRVLQDFMRENIGDITFEEAYKKTGFVLNITVAETSTYHDYRLLNYLTAPHVLLWSASIASCAIPYVFPAVELKCKDAFGNIVSFHPSGMKFIDGSVKADLPTERLAELFNVNAFIVSQTNPWVIPLLSEPDGGGSWGSSTKPVRAAKRLILMEFRHRWRQLNYLGICQSLSTLLGIFAQENRGHVTIWPVPSFKDYLNILSNPTPSDIQQSVLKGMKRTFPKINMLQTILAVEQVFEECYRQLKEELHVGIFALPGSLDLSAAAATFRP